MRKVLCIAATAVFSAWICGTAWSGEKEGTAKEAAPRESAAVQCAKGKFARRLGLTEDQAKKMKELRKARKEAAAPLREKLKAETKILAKLVREEATDKEIAAVLARVQEAKKDLQGEKERFKSRLEALLTPSQQAKMLIASARLSQAKARQGGRGRGMRGWRGHEGGRGGRQGRGSDQIQDED